MIPIAETILSHFHENLNPYFSKGGIILQTVGVICEYNPLHLGHRKQLDALKADGHNIVCLMSGNYVQRGAPAILDKMLRAKAAVLSGADLVLELPVTAALSSAEGFADEGVRLLSPFCDGLCFGAEDTSRLTEIAQALLSDRFPPALRQELDKGLSFPAARQAALQSMGLDSSILEKPNNILAVEYCKAILSRHSSMLPMPIHREGSYHDDTPDSVNPSATAIRKLMLDNNIQRNWRTYTPDEAIVIFENATLHSLDCGERAVLCKLRGITDSEFEALPYGSEGLWRKLMHASRSCSTLEEIAATVKSKRYTRSRIDRMILCAFLGLTASDLSTPAPYARVLAFNDTGRSILNHARKYGLYPNIGEEIDHPYQQIESHADSLYGLFAHGTPESPHRKDRIIYIPSTKRG